MREPNWMLVSVVVLGVVTVVLASIWESTYDVRHCASDDARRSGNGSWYFSCLIAAVPVLFILTGSVTESFEFRDESVEVEEDDAYTVMVSDGNGGYEKRRYGVDEVKVIFDSTEEDARVEEVDVVRDYDVTRTPFFAFDMKGECREVEHQTRIHVPEGSWGEHQFSVN